MNIILCGMMGAGKTTVGVAISKLSERTWYDTDQMIEDKHGKISDIFEYYGENHFRTLETNCIREFAEKDNLIISTGGGLVLRPENNEILKKNGKIVFLCASIETLVGRLKIHNNRPLIQGNEMIIEKKLRELMEIRTPVYENVADYVVNVDGKTVEDIAKEILEVVNE